MSNDPDGDPSEVPDESGVNLSTFDDGTELERTIGLRGGLSIPFLGDEEVRVTRRGVDPVFVVGGGAELTEE